MGVEFRCQLITSLLNIPLCAQFSNTVRSTLNPYPEHTLSLTRSLWSSSSPPRKDGLPDWLQPTTVIVPSITAPRAQGKEDDVDVTADHRGGGLDWLKDAASPDTKVAVTPRAAAIAHEIMDESKPAQGTDDAPGRISATDWLGAALRGETPKALIAQQGESAATKAPGESKYLLTR